ncbi:hypothetical protein C475_13002 [Halosimplex carlsbadense 2-9-1]|uniref:Extracellular solute-binding protein family 5 n=1 Tax=Halosimplex carlsbadense 2-9-1 TaxID=797114 RepID=M0CNG6_9EURY|nr:hypothetical protein [Halosimplex carlsbadense]ELZ24168.1 hypothetical protein C475_13002 [Halosimplex carlsbadense 2-9-1]
MAGDPHDRGDIDGGADSGRTGSGTVDRRAFISIAGTAAAAALSGCSNESDGDSTTAGRQREVDGPVVSVMTGAQPSTLDMGPSMNTPAGRPHFEGFLQSLVLPTHAPTGESLTSGHTWTVDGSTLSVPCAVESFEGTDGGSIRYRFDDRLTYWSGEPLDGRAYYLRDRIGWLETNGAFREESFGSELESDTVYRREPLAGPTNPVAARANAHPGMAPLPPAYSEPWVEQFADATTEEAVRQTYLDYHQGKLSVETFAEEGYGTGRYEVRSADDVTSELVELPHGLRTNTEFVYAEPRSEYPGPTDRPTLRIVCGAGMGAPAMSGLRGGGGGGRPSGSLYDPRDFVNGDEIDFGRGVIAESKADFFRKQVPDDIEQLRTWPNPAGGGRQLTFNWANDHLRRLWVRRAIVAAAPFGRMRSNQYGRGSMAPSSDAGTLGSIAERALGESFVESLYTYPLESDTDLAARWLRRAGYERVDGLWTGPDGEELSLLLSVFSSEIGDVQTLVARLKSFGIAVETEQLLAGGISYEGNVEAGGFDLLVSNAPAGRSVLPYYGDWFSVWESGMSMPPIAVAGNPLGSCREDPPLASVPASVTLPSEPGSLAVDGADYGDGGATYEHDAGETVALCEAVDRLRDGGTDAEGFREAARRCARWYNYAVPNFVFAQDRTGLWAELSEFSVSADADRSLGMSRGEPAAPVHYHVQAGTLRRSDAGE